jgi:metallo-beta-lactamase family protein
LSHAHIDHCGRIPLLVKRGFDGPIYCSDATAVVLGIMLRDSAHIHENEAEWKTRKALRAGKDPVEPLYTTEDAENSLKTVRPVRYGETVQAAEDVRFVFRDAGHILGSAIAEIFVREGGAEKKLVFSGDLGASHRPLLNDPTVIEEADAVIMETTYGDRLHEENQSSLAALSNIIETTMARGGTVLIPSFAVGRTQELLYELNAYAEQSGRNVLTGVKVYVDSPMAAAATEAFRKNVQDFDAEAQALVRKGDDPLDFATLVFTNTTEESKALNRDETPKIIISASGMCEAGRIRHHLKHHLWKRTSSVVFVGYQAEGTLGRRITEGAKTVMLFGEEIAVRAQIYNLQGFSAHADKNGLLAWVKGFTKKPRTLILVHGEAEPKRAFAQTVEKATGIRPFIVEHLGQTVEL